MRQALGRERKDIEFLEDLDSEVRCTHCGKRMRLGAQCTCPLHGESPAVPPPRASSPEPLRTPARKKLRLAAGLLRGELHPAERAALVPPPSWGTLAPPSHAVVEFAQELHRTIADRRDDIPATQYSL